jgi:hypothetical protein
MTDAKLIMHRDGGFDDCAISGNWYTEQDGNRFWDVTIVSAVNYRKESKRVNVRCLVSGENFYCANVERPYPFYEVQKGKAVDIDPDVRQGVLTTIRKWENDEVIAAKPELEP